MSTAAVETFFDNTGGGAGAPSIKLSQVNDGVVGEIVDQFMAPAYEYGTKNQKVDKKTGALIEQLVVIVQTDLRNWDRVAKIPVVDHTDPNSPPKPPSEDDGKRAIYIEPWTNIHAAVGRAVVEGTGKKGPLLNGGRLGVKIANLKNTGKGNPLKEHQAVYTPPVASGNDFFGAGNTAAGGVGAAQDPFAGQNQAPAGAPAQQAPAQDPWSGQPVSNERVEEPPF